MYLAQISEDAPSDGPAVLAEIMERLPEADKIWYSCAGKLGATSNGTLPPDSLPTLEAAFRACRWERADGPGDGFVYWNRVSVGPFTFYDGSPLASYCHYDGLPYEGMPRVSYEANGEMDWYYVPEGYLTVQAALRFESDSVHSLEQKKALYLYQQARNEWDSFQFGWMHERYDGVSETEVGNWPCVGFFESVADLRGYLETMFSPELAEDLLSTQVLREQDGRLHYMAGGMPSNLYAGEVSVQVYPTGPGEATWMPYNGRVLTRTAILGEDLETVTGYKEHEFFYKWNGTHYVFISFGPWDDIGA